MSPECDARHCEALIVPLGRSDARLEEALRAFLPQSENVTMSDEISTAQTLFGHSGPAAGLRQSTFARGFPCPDPDQGLRLMRAFMSIRQPSLRRAIIEMVTELSACDEQRGSLTGN